MATEQLTLTQLNRQIKEALLGSFPSSVWVVAEIMELNINRSGHCYMELIEKAEDHDQIIARIRATIWAFQFRMLRPYFETTTGTTLGPGLKILFKCTVEFHEQYGLSLNITDIDPNYTMGDLARKKQEVIRRLRSEGVYDMNRETELPLVPQRIAVISSETAAGYGDFMNSLRNNAYSYVFYTSLFPAVMQGQGAETAVISALEQIYDQLEHFDCIVLIRGGGSQADLECFNSYGIAAHIAQFPLPVLTGIGHERDETVADLVAHTRLKTPTAVAEFLIDQLAEFDAYLQQMEEHFGMLVKQYLLDKQGDLRALSTSLDHLVKRVLLSQESELQHYRLQLKKAAGLAGSNAGKKLVDLSARMKILRKNLLNSENRNLGRYEEILRRVAVHSLQAGNNKLKMLEKHVELVDPSNILKRGYTLSSVNGKIITSVKGLAPGDELITNFRDGTVNSRIEKINKKTR